MKSKISDVVDRLRILREMGFVPGNLAFNKLDKQAIRLTSDPASDPRTYIPKIKIISLADDSIEQDALVCNLFTLEMIPDLLDNLRIQMGEKESITSTRLIDEIRETNHEISILIKSHLRQKKDELCLISQHKQ